MSARRKLSSLKLGANGNAVESELIIYLITNNFQAGETFRLLQRSGIILKLQEEEPVIGFLAFGIHWTPLVVLVGVAQRRRFATTDGGARIALLRCARRGGCCCRRRRRCRRRVRFSRCRTRYLLICWHQQSHQTGISKQKKSEHGAFRRAM